MNNTAFRYLHRSSIGIPVAAMMVAATFMVSPVRSVLGQEYLTVSEAILSNPVVQQQRAQVCQARSRYDQARSSQLPQIDFSVSGGALLTDNFNRSGRLSSPAEEYAVGRRFDDKNIDGTVRLTQSIYDGSRTKMSKQIAENDQQAAKLLVIMETETAAADIISVGLDYYLQQQLHDHFTRQLAELKTVTSRIQERVELGAGRVSDLRESRLPGSVTDIQIKLGDKVAKGDVLFKIEDEDVKANFADNEIQRLAALASIQRLEAEAQGLTQLHMPDWLVKSAPDAVRQEEEVFSSRRRALKNERQVIIQQIETLRRAIDVQKSEESLAKIQLSQIDQERAIIAPLVEAGHEPKLALINLESRYQETLGRAEKARLEAIHSESELITQERRLASLDTNFQADAETRLIETRVLAAQTEARLDALEGKVQQTEVKSPVDGTISAVHFSTIGGVVDAGAVLAEVVPAEEEVTIEAQVMTQDVADIYAGLKVRISLSAYDVSRYGAIEGYVEKIATNSTQKENQPPYYQTIIKIPDPTFPQSGIKPDIVPGMPVVVDVLGGKRTVLDYILSPIERASTIIFREK